MKRLLYQVHFAHVTEKNKRKRSPPASCSLYRVVWTTEEYNLDQGDLHLMCLSWNVEVPGWNSTQAHREHGKSAQEGPGSVMWHNTVFQWWRSTKMEVEKKYNEFWDGLGLFANATKGIQNCYWKKNWYQWKKIKNTTSLNEFLKFPRITKQ